MSIVRRNIRHTAVGSKTLTLPTTMTSTSKVYRCRRCSGRKFRTPRDLALHILAKHGHTKLSIGISSPESIGGNDVHSITFMSPVISGPKGDGKVTSLFRRIHSKGDSNFSKTSEPMSTKCRPDIVKQAHPKTTARRPRVYAHTISSEPSDSPRDPVSPMSPSHFRLRTLKPPVRISRPVSQIYEGESTGPLAQDIYVQQCHDGRIPLVPVSSQPVKTLNFAQGFF